ncbi:fimbrial protein [Burkholderia pseudomultivorans]|uniref:fimbrial protein n=1 Tax=Burkholderia pseudomultivorans TaxID=1207504 RepID=UPI000759B071|nr:fimbrial protein [Burkholderia pseudomultivorans]KVG68301.1 fimbrial protein [Burkholderia pseudomultivorans]
MKAKDLSTRLLLVAATMFGFAGSSTAANIYAFGGKDIAVPSAVPPGTTLSRYTFSPNELCGDNLCEISVVGLYNKGSVWGVGFDGPDLETNVPGVSVRLFLDGRPVTSRFTGTFSRIGELQLFRDSGLISGGDFSSGSFNSYYIISYKTGLISSRDSSIRLTGKVTAISATCEVPDQNVKLPPVTSGQLHGIGATAGDTPFNLAVTGCPRGFNRVGYTLLPAGGSVPDGSGTLPLLPESSATGASIHVVDASGMPPKFGASLPVTAYSKDAGGSYQIPMRASYVQTAGKVTGGSVRAAIVVLLDYQ